MVVYNFYGQNLSSVVFVYVRACVYIYNGSRLKLSGGPARFTPVVEVFKGFEMFWGLASELTRLQCSQKLFLGARLRMLEMNPYGFGCR